MSSDQALLVWTHQLTQAEHDALELISPNPAGDIDEFDRELEFLMSRAERGFLTNASACPECGSSSNLDSTCCPTKALSGGSECCELF